MKNHNKDANNVAKRCMALQKIIKSTFTILSYNEAVINSMLVIYCCVDAGYYLLRYITSLTSLTVLGTSGNAAATRLGA